MCEMIFAFNRKFINWSFCQNNCKYNVAGEVGDLPTCKHCESPESVCTLESCPLGCHYIGKREFNDLALFQEFIARNPWTSTSTLTDEQEYIAIDVTKYSDKYPMELAKQCNDYYMKRCLDASNDELHDSVSDKMIQRLKDDNAYIDFVLDNKNVISEFKEKFRKDKELYDQIRAEYDKNPDTLQAFKVRYCYEIVQFNCALIEFLSKPDPVQNRTSTESIMDRYTALRSENNMLVSMRNYIQSMQEYAKRNNIEL